MIDVGENMSIVNIVKIKSWGDYLLHGEDIHIHMGIKTFLTSNHMCYVYDEKLFMLAVVKYGIQFEEIKCSV